MFLANDPSNQNFIAPSKLELYITRTISTYKLCWPVSCQKIEIKKLFITPPAELNSEHIALIAGGPDSEKT